MGVSDVVKMQQITGHSSSERPKGDFYATPEVAVRRLLSVESFHGDVLEPCCGNGAISKVLETYDLSVTSRDLYDWGYGETGRDYFSGPAEDFDSVITNPPFVLFQEFVERSLDFVKTREGKVAMLGRLQGLEGVKKKRLYERGNLKKVWVFSARLPRMHKFNYTGKTSTSMIAFAWYVWDYKHTGEPTIGWL